MNFDETLGQEVAKSVSRVKDTFFFLWTMKECSLEDM